MCRIGVILLGALALTPAPTLAQAPTIRIANFNIQVFGQKKAGKRAVMNILSRVAREFDVMAVEEFRDASGQTPRVYLAWINQDTSVRYDMVVGPPEGRSSSKEQYAVYYNTRTVQYVDGHIVADHRFERPPMVARFVAGNFDFRLVVSHIKPEDASRELAALAQVAVQVNDSTEHDVIMLGDFNADCGYFDETEARHPLRDRRFHWVIGNDAQTAVKTGCTYDRIVLTDGTFGHEYVPNSALVFRYDRAFGIRSSTTVRNVSDHFPVFAVYWTDGPDDDGPPPH